MPQILLLALTILQILIERITGHRFKRWPDGEPKWQPTKSPARNTKAQKPY